MCIFIQYARIYVLQVACGWLCTYMYFIVYPVRTCVSTCVAKFCEINWIYIYMYVFILHVHDGLYNTHTHIYIHMLHVHDRLKVYYICIYIYIYIYKYMLHVHDRLKVYTDLHKATKIYKNVCMYVCMYVCMLCPYP
jgi:hypothetical protein